MNFARLGVNVHTIFDPCTNLHAGSEILASDYTFAEQRYGSGQIALHHAIGMYNTGRLDRGARYVQAVLAAAGIRGNYEEAPRAIGAHEAMRSPVLVHAPIVRHRPLRIADSVITPSRAPILVTVARATHMTLF